MESYSFMLASDLCCWRNDTWDGLAREEEDGVWPWEGRYRPGGLPDGESEMLGQNVKLNHVIESDQIDRCCFLKWKILKLLTLTSVGSCHLLKRD